MDTFNRKILRDIIYLLKNEYGIKVITIDHNHLNKKENEHIKEFFVKNIGPSNKKIINKNIIEKCFCYKTEISEEVKKEYPPIITLV